MASYHHMLLPLGAVVAVALVVGLHSHSQGSAELYQIGDQEFLSMNSGIDSDTYGDSRSATRVCLASSQQFNHLTMMMAFITINSGLVHWGATIPKAKRQEICILNCASRFKQGPCGNGRESHYKGENSFKTGYIILLAPFTTCRTVWFARTQQVRTDTIHAMLLLCDFAGGTEGKKACSCWLAHQGRPDWH